MMDEKTFTIVFEKLAAAGDSAADAFTSEAGRAEIDEIDELRRVVLEITEPEPVSYITA